MFSGFRVGRRHRSSGTLTANVDLWYAGIARCGVARTSICAFAEPLVATLFSLFVLRDAPPTPMLIAGASLVLCAIAVSAGPAADR